MKEQPENAVTTRNESTAVMAKPIDRFKQALSSPTVQEQFKNALQDNAPLFVASLIDIYGADQKLQKCAPGLVIMEALKAATLKLPINKNLGFAYIIPYDKSVKDPVSGQWSKVPIPQFQPGYRAFIQLAMRTGQYRFINADVVYEGERAIKNRITGELVVSGEPKSEDVIGYFAYFETLNGFSKADYWTKEKLLSHARKFSKSYNKKDSCFTKDSAWDTSFDSMALKTVLKTLLSKYGILSVEMISAITDDRDEEAEAQREIEANANQEVIDVEVLPAQETGPVNGAEQHALHVGPNAGDEPKHAEAGPAF